MGNKKESQIMFETNAEESLINVVRRYVSEIPILAVDEVEISKNDSAMYDETLAHRIGLIPLKMEANFKEGSDIQLSLSVSKPGYVYSGELKGGAEVVFEKIPILFLNKNQEVELIAHAKIGKGSEHSKFSPGMISYRNKMKVLVDKGFKEDLDVCKGIKELNGKTILIDTPECDKIELCIEGLKNLDREEVSLESTGEVEIKVESFGQIPPKEILTRAVKELKRDLSFVSKELK